MPPTRTSTALPAQLPAADVAEWSDEVDVLVVGLGIAGGCAAVEAAAAGARVLVLERAAVAGGTTSQAGGHFYLGGGTAVQRATGHEDSAEQMAAYLMAVSRDPEPDKIRAYSDGSVEHFDWLEGLGFAFERSYYPEKAVIQPGTEGLMYTGNEKVWPYRDLAVPAPRGHKVPVPGDTRGAALVMDLLVARAEALGVDVRYETGATGLVVDDEGRVVGAGWRSFERTGAVRAGAVVLAAGGFVMNAAMVAEHVPQLAEKPFVLGSSYDDGLGIRLGQSAGGATRHMDQAFITAPVYPPSRLLTGIIVNREGRRFVAEDSYHSRTSGFVMEQPGAVAYLVVDADHLEQPIFPLAPFIDGWESVPEMEAALGIPTGALQETLADYNAAAARGEDPAFHKAAEWLEPQDQGPWGAFDLTLGKALYAGFTMGGLRTSVDGQVLTEDASVIGGLYAAGACAANIAQDGKGYCSGTQLGEGSFFGRRAGRHAAVRSAPTRMAGLHHAQLAMPPGEEAAARAFYVDALGLAEVEKPPVLVARGGCWFRGGALELHLGVEAGFRPALKAHPGILVDGLDALVDRLASHGVDVRWDEDFPGHRRCYVDDCFGNRLELLEPEGRG